ncbi:MAG: hypothetical protein OEQ47_19235 [Acidimicrobiia bacterium]|nr:hypothetical protein [Acidimicrobiia bacterium]
MSHAASLPAAKQPRRPESIDEAQVLEHALRHLAWLAAEDEVVASTLDDGWHEALSHYVPEPFRQLEGAD